MERARLLETDETLETVPVPTLISHTSSPIDTLFTPQVHESAAQQGQTAPPARDDECQLHFVAFVQSGGQLWELDGRKPAPIPHGECDESSVLQVGQGGWGTSQGEIYADDSLHSLLVCMFLHGQATAAVVTSKFMAADPDNMNFSMVALGPGSD